MNAYAMNNHYGNRADGGRTLHVFATRAARDRWVGDGLWNESVGDFTREPVTVAEAVRVRDRICRVYRHGHVALTDQLRSLCASVWPFSPVPDVW